jgi:hypothetical protein
MTPIMIGEHDHKDLICTTSPFRDGKNRDAKNRVG